MWCGEIYFTNFFFSIYSVLFFFLVGFWIDPSVFFFLLFFISFSLFLPLAALGRFSTLSSSHFFQNSILLDFLPYSLISSFYSFLLFINAICFLIVLKILIVVLLLEFPLLFSLFLPFAVLFSLHFSVSSGRSLQSSAVWDIILGFDILGTGPMKGTV